MFENRFEEIDRIVKGIARKYSSTKWIEYEELYQELWIKVSELLKSNPEVSLNMIARCCFNCAVDLYRYSRRRYEANSEYVEDGGFDGNPTLSHVTFENPHTHLLIRELLDMFAPHSIERNFILVKLYIDGSIEKHDFSDDEILDRVPEGKVTDRELALLLGFKSSRPPKWVSTKRDVRSIVLDFLNAK